jgi:flagellar biosynthesis protein FlhA
LYVVTIGPVAEQRLAEGMQPGEGGLTTALSPEVAATLLQRAGEEVEKMAQAGHMGVLLCSARARLVLRRFTQRGLPQVAILSYSEIPAGVDVYACGMVEVNDGA